MHVDSAATPVPFRVLIGRRQVLQGGIAALAHTFLRQSPPPRRGNLLGFAGIPPSSADEVRVPVGYTATPFAPWGDPIGHRDGAPAFAPDASNSAAEQALQFGMHHDGMHFFPLPDPADRPRGILCVNHEYFDRGLLHPAKTPFTFAREQVQKEINAVGISVCEVLRTGGAWRVVPNSHYARRITGDSELVIGGPVQGDMLLRTAADPRGTAVRGTLNNCSAGITPWNTFLSCEENFPDFFTNLAAPQSEEQHEYGLGPGVYGWANAAGDFPACERFDVARHPNEPHRFGWVVELDPYDPTRPPVKQTALGRFRHENAAVTLSRGDRGRVVVYMGDDEINQHLYKFVSSRDHDPAAPREANRDLLGDGTLYVARFEDDGTGRWIPLTPAHPALAGMTQAQILVFARIAARRVQATPMDRPEWIAIDPVTRRVYCSLTNNTGRTEPGHGANPRHTNAHGHVIWWHEAEDPSGTRFAWDVFVLGGDPVSTVRDNVGDGAGDSFSAPDGLAFDARGVLWIQTDVSSTKMFHPLHTPGRREFAAFRNNQMLAVDRGADAKGVPDKTTIRRFLTGPVGCEITGFTMLPSLRTLFVNVQHPGEPLADKVVDNDPANPTRYSSWPDGGRPRSAIVAIERTDGGTIGS